MPTGFPLGSANGRHWWEIGRQKEEDGICRLLAEAKGHVPRSSHGPGGSQVGHSPKDSGSFLDGGVRTIMSFCLLTQLVPCNQFPALNLVETSRAAPISCRDTDGCWGQQVAGIWRVSRLCCASFSEPQPRWGARIHLSTPHTRTFPPSDQNPDLGLHLS